MPQFLILLRDDGTRPTGEKLQQQMQRYGAWSESLRQGGHLVGANKLRDGEGRVVRRDASEMIVISAAITSSPPTLTSRPSS